MYLYQCTGGGEEERGGEERGGGGEGGGGEGRREGGRRGGGGRRGRDYIQEWEMSPSPPPHFPSLPLERSHGVVAKHIYEGRRGMFLFHAVYIVLLA